MASLSFVAILGVVGVLGALWVLSVINNRQQKKLLREVTRPREFRTFDTGLTGEILPPEQTSLSTYQVPRAAPAPSYQVENRQPRHVQNLETGFLVPFATAGGTAIALTIAAGALALAFGWPVKTVLIIFALSLAGGWLWRLGVADKIIWNVERVTRQDLDGDGTIGAPMTHLAVIQPEAARQDIARQTRQTTANERLVWLQAFVHRCYVMGCSESAQGIKPGDRARYLEARDLLLRLGLAVWRDEANKRLGWQMTTDEATAVAIITHHVTAL
jgi:hypothetical protein